MIVEGDLCRRFQGIGHRYVEPIQEADQRCLALEERAIHRGSRAHGICKDQICNLALLVTKKLPQRKHVLAIDLIQQANDFRSFGLAERVDQLCLIIFRELLQRLNPGAHIVIAEVQYREREFRGFAGNGRLEFGSTRRQSHLAFGIDRIPQAIRPVAVDAGLIAIALKKRTDGIVPSHARNIDHRRLDPFFIDARTIRVLRQIALRRREMLHKFRLDRLSRTFLGQPQRASRVMNYLNGFKT